MEVLRVGVAQMNSIDDVNSNVEQIIELMKAACDESPVDVLCFPENCLFLRLSKSTLIPEISLNSEAIYRIEKMASDLNIHVLLGSVPIGVARGKLSNATVFVKPESSAAVVYEKMHLFDVDVKGAPPVRESDSFRPGPGPAVVEINGWKFGLSICYDLRFSSLFNEYALANVDGVLVPSAFLVPTGRAHWHTLLRARAIESQCYVVAAAQAGLHKNSKGESRETYGHSLVVDPWGEILVDLETEAKTVKTVELCRAKIEWVRSQIPQRSHRR